MPDSADKYKGAKGIRRKPPGEYVRPSAAKRGYDRHWHEMREQQLRLHPLCQECAKSEIIEEATIVDHIVPHRGNKTLFNDPNNWQSLCVRCHSRKTGKGE